MAQKKIEEDGIWRTVGGRRIFIKDGEDLSTAMMNSGKFGSDEKKEQDRLKAKDKYMNGVLIEKERSLQKYINLSPIGQDGFIAPETFKGEGAGKEFVLARKYKDGAYLIEKEKLEKRYGGDVKKALNALAGYQLRAWTLVEKKWELR